MESEQTDLLNRLFSGDVPKDFKRFEKLVKEDDFNPQPTVVFINGREVRLSYNPSDISSDGHREVKIIGIQNFPEETLKLLGTYFTNEDLRVKLAKYDGRSVYEDIDI